MIDEITSPRFQILIEEWDYFGIQAPSVLEVKNNLRIQLKVCMWSTQSCARLFFILIYYFTDYQKPVCVHAHKENILECQIALIK